MLEIIIGSIPLLLALAVNIRLYKKLEPHWLRLFTWFLMVTFLIQTGGYYYSHIFKKSNHFIFNLYTLFNYSFYIFIFYKTLQNPVFKKIALLIGIFFFLFYIYQIFILKQLFTYSSVTGNTGEFLTLCCCFLYLGELLMADRIIDFFVIPMFWITTGIMIASIGDFLYLCFFDYIIKNNLDPDGSVYGVITVLLSIIQYIFFTIGFICKKRE